MKLKKLFLVWLFILPLLAQAQQITSGEYFIDTDPGNGNGMSLPSFAMADSVIQTVNLNTNSLSIGFHRIYYRYKYDNGSWGIPEDRLFYIYDTILPVTLQQAAINRGEYFIDTDPGVGNGTNLPSFSAADSVIQTINLNTTGLSVGFHRVYYRYSDQNGQWGIPEDRLFYIYDTMPPALVNQAPIALGEYFIDTDPGAGNGTALSSFASADSVIQNLTINVGSLSLGSHALFIRYRDSAGNWGIPEPRIFNVCASVPTANITYTGGLNICGTGSVALSTSFDNTYTYQWLRDGISISGATTNTYSANITGAYSVMVSNASGCSAEAAAVNITQSANPSATINASNTTICSGDSAMLTANTGGGYTYQWRLNNVDITNATGISQYVSAAGAYTVIVSNVNGCSTVSNATTLNVTSAPLAIIAQGATTSFCQGDSITLTVSTGTGYTYQWKNGGININGANASFYNTFTPGNFSVTVTSGLCSVNSLTTVVLVNPLPTVSISASGNTTFCQGDSVILTSSNLSNNSWLPGNQTSQSITVTQAGNYSVIATDANGCSAVSNVINVSVTGTPPIPTNLGGPFINCGPITLDAANQGAGYLWSNGDTTQTINVTQSGIYYVDITNQCGTVQSSIAIITINPIPNIPTITASGPTDFCFGDTVVLTSSEPANNIWSPNSETTQSITISQTGNYYTVIANAFGCSASSNIIAVNVANNPPFTNLGGPFTQCGGAITLDASNAGASYLWSNGDTSQTINVNQSGNYYVAVTNSCGTVLSDTVEVTINPIPSLPTITANGPTSFCPGFSLTLSTNYSSGNLWSTGQNSNSITVDTAATFSVSYTDTLGCTSAPAGISTSFISNIAPPLFSLINNNITTSPATVTFNNNTPNLSQYNFLWNFGDGSSINDNNATIYHNYNTNGVFHVSLTLFDPNTGCSSTNYNPNNPQQSVVCNVSSNNNCGFTPVINPIGLINACIGGTVNLSLNNNTYPAGSTFQWNKNGVSLGGENFTSYNATSNGFYTVTVFDTNACPVMSAPTQVIFNLPAAQTPTITQSGPSGNCGIVNATLTANGNFGAYIWNTGQIGNSINISQSGIYWAVGQGGTGCDASSAQVNISSSTLAIPEICMITIDSITNQSIIVWEKDLSMAISGYGIYKESSFNSNNYQQIAIVPYDSLSEYTDVNSNAEVLAERYRISVIDTCYGETPLSSAVRAIGLKVFPGIGVQRSLSWNHYVGDNQNITQYSIYSGANINQLSLLNTVSASTNNYIDAIPVNGLNTIYRVYAELSQTCESTRAIRNKSISNSTGNLQSPFVNSVNENARINIFDFNIYPNPNNGVFTLVLANNNGAEASIYDITGKLLIQEKLTGKMNTINAQSLSRGTYLVRVTDMNGFATQKLVIVN